MSSEAQDAVIRVDSMHKSYAGKEVLAGLSLSVKRGEVFGLLGPNGSGKTTMLEIIVGLRKPTSGTVSVFGLNPAKARRETTARVAVQPQGAALFPTLTVDETVRLFASFYPDARNPRDVIEEISLVESARTRVRHLSGGQERRLLIGLALVGNPDVLVLDEPSAGLDPAARRGLWQIIDRQRRRGATILLSTHHMDEATQVCDRLAILTNGHIAVQGRPDDLIREFRATTRVFFTVPQATSNADLEALRLNGVFETRTVPDGLRVTVETADPDAVLRRLTFSPGLRTFDFYVEHHSLEDLFLEVAHTTADESASS